MVSKECVLLSVHATDTNGVKSYMFFMKGMKNAHSFFSLLTSKQLKPN